MAIYEHTKHAVEHLYRRIADGASRDELLEIVHDQWGARYDLRPPVQEIRLAQLCGTETRPNG